MEVRPPTAPGARWQLLFDEDGNGALVAGDEELAVDDLLDRALYRRPDRSICWSSQ